MILDRRFSLFGYRFSFRTNDAPAAGLLSRLYQGREDARISDDTDVYELWSEPPDRWTIRVPGSPPEPKRTFGEAISWLEASITTNVARHPHGLHVVHGGVVYGPAGDLLLTGESGAGKTTLSLALHSRGLRVGCDDMAVLDPASGMFLPHPRCFHIDESSARLLAGLGLNLPEDLLRIEFVTPADLGQPTPVPARIRFVFLLESERLGYPRILPETQAQAVSTLLLQTGRGHIPDLEAVRSIASLVGDARCFRLWSGELGPTVDSVLRIVHLS